jgi:hypothetical protein
VIWHVLVTTHTPTFQNLAFDAFGVDQGEREGLSERLGEEEKYWEPMLATPFDHPLAIGAFHTKAPHTRENLADTAVGLLACSGVDVVAVAASGCCRAAIARAASRCLCVRHTLATTLCIAPASTSLSHVAPR